MSPITLWWFDTATYGKWPVEIDDQHDDFPLNLVIFQFATFNNQGVAWHSPRKSSNCVSPGTLSRYFKIVIIANNSC